MTSARPTDCEAARKSGKDFRAYFYVDLNGFPLESNLLLFTKKKIIKIYPHMANLKSLKNQTWLFQPEIFATAKILIQDLNGPFPGPQ